MKRLLIITLFSFLSINIYSQGKPLEFKSYKPTYVPRHNVDAIRQMLEANHQRAMAEAEEIKQRAIVKMNQTITFYNSVENYPLTIKDGWHRVTSMNNYDFCVERLVYVNYNKITKYYINEEHPYREVLFSSSIKNAKATIRIKYPNGETSELLDIYFIESILDPTSKAKSPY